MEASERAIANNYSKLKTMMFLFNAQKLYLSNIHLLDTKREKFEERVSAILESLDSLEIDFSKEMNATKKKKWKILKRKLKLKCPLTSKILI